MQFISMTAKHFREITSGNKPSKYHAQKTTLDGITYDSKKECRRAIELEYLQKAGKIKNLQRQVRFILQEGFVNNEKKTIRPIYYFADFCYEKNGIKIVEDTKGVKTEVYKIKKKLFQYKYPEYKFIEG